VLLWYTNFLPKFFKPLWIPNCYVAPTHKDHHRHYYRVSQHIFPIHRSLLFSYIIYFYNKKSTLQYPLGEVFVLFAVKRGTALGAGGTLEAVASATLRGVSTRVATYLSVHHSAHVSKLNITGELKPPIIRSP
jgi:hypothetical protein